MASLLVSEALPDLGVEAVADYSSLVAAWSPR